MAFQIKDFASISASMLNWMKSVQQKFTDFNIGGVVRTMLESVATEIEQLYQQMFIGIREAIPVSTYNTFNFPALAASGSTGLVRVSITVQAAAVVIPNNTVFSIAGNSTTWSSTASVTIAAGASYADVPVAATTTGASTNITAGQSFTVNPQPTAFISATNLQAFQNGSDAETPAAQQLRFNAYIQALSRGTVAALGYGLSTVNLTDSLGNITERVVSSQVVEPYLTDNTQPIGLVDCYIHNGVGSTSSALVAQAQKVIYGYYDTNGKAVPGWKSAGTHVVIAAATEVLVNIGGTITPAPGYTQSALDTLANQAAYSYILGLGIGQTFQVSSLVDLIMNIPGVENFNPADVAVASAPTLGQVAGGTMAATTYYVAITYVTPNGESLPTTTQSLAVAANSLLTVASPPQIAGVTGWNVYVGTSAGSLQKQTAAPIGIGLNYTEPTSGLIAGSAPPTVSTARLADVTASTGQKFMPGSMAIA